MTRALAWDRADPPLRATVALCAAALALGVFADQGQRLPGFWSLVPELGTPWVLLGFAGGRVWRRHWPTALLMGTSLVVLALWAYYVYLHLQYGTEMYNAMNGSRGWHLTVFAAVLGASSAVAGALTGSTRASTRTASWAFAVAVPTTELWRAARYDTHLALQALLTITAAGLLLHAGRRALRWPALLVATSVWVALGLAALVVLPSSLV